MKYILSLFIVVLFYGCFNAKRQYPDNFNAYNDSIDICIERFQQERDTSFIIKAIGYCDVLEKMQSDRKGRFAVIQKKCQLFGLIGEFRKAFLLRGKAVELLDDNDVRRLEFYGLKYKCEGDTAKSSLYFNKAVAECDKDLSVRDNVTKKVELLIMSGKKDEAKYTLREYLKNHNDEDVRIMLDNFQLLCEEISEGLLLLYGVNLQK